MNNVMFEMIENGGRNYGYVGFSTFFKALFSPIALPSTIIMILLLICLCMAARKAPRWIRPIGQISMIIMLLQIAIGIRQLYDCYQRLGFNDENRWTNGYIGMGMKPVICVAMIGVIIYLLSLFISIAQKPRI
ncbi:MAG: hypothetical protein IK039_05705 [Bacteroidaceae bacterium]|nr:hypothetical protein [Bacteroidaceae bacterium]